MEGGSLDQEGTVPRQMLRASPARFLNRELSWLDFADRLLAMAEDGKLAVLERLRFIGIIAEGLDEFFQVRVAGLRDQLESGLVVRSPDGMTPAEQLAAIRERTQSVFDRHSGLFTGQIVPELAEAGIELVDHHALTKAEQHELSELFERQIFPVLTPLAVDPSHPFPYISNLSLNLAVVIEDPAGGESRFARVKVPPLLSRFVAVPTSGRLVPLEQLIAAHFDWLFPDMFLGAHYVFRVTRNADLDVDDNDADDLLAAVELELRRRRFGRAVRLEIDPQMSSDTLELLLRELELGPDDVYRIAAPLDLSGLAELLAIDRPDLKEPAWAPMTPSRLSGRDSPSEFFSAIKEKDLLVHHPYDSFATSVEAFITQAAADPDVLAIKQTLYRTSGDAPFVGALARAAEAGKQVAALVEVTARFEEQNNIEWGRQLEQAGVHVVYGVVGLKTHLKTALVVRREEDGLRRYCHVGTGNYNSFTARAYEDLGVLSADPDLCADLTDLFNYLTGFSHPTTSRALVVAPQRLRSWVLERIDEQRRLGEGGRIVIKANGLTDPEVIDALYDASQAGCEIDLVIRGQCSLRPGLQGLSEHIRVRSILGSFLEHSRIYRFGLLTSEVAANMVIKGCSIGAGDNPARYFIGSPDLMQRNLDQRIEALVPVRDEELCARLEDVLQLCLEDDTSSWELTSWGAYRRIATTKGVSLQSRLKEFAIERARRRPHDRAS